MWELLLDADAPSYNSFSFDPRIYGAPVLAPVGMDSRVFCLCKQVARTNESVIDLCVKLEHVYLRSSAGP